ncbi:phasin family protein [Massilia cavernae]|nr:phasin family protein [Massilia cavernae]
MSTIPEQFSAASKAQIEAQLDFFQSFGTRAFDGAARLLALNFDTGRAAVDSSSAALKQLIEVRDPRDLIALAKNAPQDIDKVMHYGRELFSIVSDVQAGLLKPAARAALPVALATVPPQAAQSAVQSALFATPAAQAPVAAPVETAPVDAAPVEDTPVEEAPAEEAPVAAAEEARPVKASKKPVVAVKQGTAPGPAAAEKPIARAAGKVAGPALDVAPSAAALLEDTAHQILPHLKPVEATLPPAVFHQDLLTPKRGKKR